MLTNELIAAWDSSDLNKCFAILEKQDRQKARKGKIKNLINKIFGTR